MANLILDNIYVILLLPLWIFLIIMSARFFAVYVNDKIIYTLTLLASFFGILLSAVSFLKLDTVVEQSFQFLKVGNFTLYFGLHVDKLALIMALMLFLISFFVQIFSISYMKNESKRYRFFAYLNMFNFSMAGLLFSPNLFQMYFFWELVGVMSYLLIGFDYKNKEKSEASRRVFLMNRFGDTALIGAIILSSYFMYNYGGNLMFTTLNFTDMNIISTLLYAYASTPLFYIICAMFIIGAAVKSAQFPFYTWLQDAMEAKLPVSALLHSATLVAAGAFLITRLIPLFSIDENILTVIAWLGILIAHAFIKSMLFLCLDENENYVNYVTFLLGGLSLSGLLFSGMIAKEMIFDGLNGAFAVLFCLTAFFTAFYIIRIALVMIKDKELVNSIHFARFIPIAGLFILNIIFYFVIRSQVSYKVAEPFWCALAGWLVVYILYRRDLLEKFTKTPKILENFYNNVIPPVYNKIANALNFIDVKSGSISSSGTPAAYSTPTTEPAETPAMTSGFNPTSSIAFRAPTCANPRAPPPLNAIPSL